jgi:exopolysaccharide biosynthesis protein
MLDPGNPIPITPCHHYKQTSNSRKHWQVVARLAERLLELNAVDAINPDGGASTTMVIHNQVVNKPSARAGERQVGDPILVFPKAK